MDKESALKLIGKECKSNCYEDNCNTGMIVGYSDSSYDNFVLLIIGYYTDYYTRWNNFDGNDNLIINSPMFKSYGYALLSELVIKE